MRKIFSLTFMVILLSCHAFSQSKDPLVTCAAGGIDKNSSVSLEWSLGEPFVSGAPGKENLFTEGYHQPVLLSKRLSVIEAKAQIKNLHIIIAPNPVSTVLGVSISGTIPSYLLLSLFTSSGKKLLTQEYGKHFGTSTIDMGNLPSGTYILSISGTTGIIKTFQIIKL